MSQWTDMYIQPLIMKSVLKHSNEPNYNPVIFYLKLFWMTWTYFASSVTLFNKKTQKGNSIKDEFRAGIIHPSQWV